MKTKSRNFLITILLAFMLVCSIFAITPLTAKAVEIDAGSVSVNNCSFSTNKLYYKNNSSETTNDSENYNAFYNPDTNTLVLNNYNGDCISIGGAIQENINIILVGNNVITTQDQRALSNTNGGGIYITAENDATLTINSTGSQSSVFGIYTGSWGEGKLDISGNADVRININSNRNDCSIYGTYIDGAIEIKDNAKLSVEISSQNTLSGYTVGMGLYAKKTITINTTNNVLVDTTGIPSSNGNMGVYSDAGVTLTNASQLKILVSYGSYAVAVYPATSVNAWSGFQETTNIANNILTTTYTPIEYFDITFNANGGTGTMQAVEYVGEYTLPNCTFTAPNGKQFKGWALASDGEVIDGATYNVTADVELFAIWEAVATGITATYNGTIVAGNKITPSNIAINLVYSDTTTKPVNAGNVEYWYNGSQIQDPINYVFGVELIGNVNITVKYQGFETTMAVQVVGYEITFNANGGTGDMQPVEYVGEYTLPTCAFTEPDGKQFKGWSTSANGEVIDGTTYDVTEPVTLYAIWENIPAVPTGLTASYNGTILAGNKLAINQLTVKLQYSDSSEMPCAGLCEYWYNGSQIQDPINYVFGVELIGTRTITVKYLGLETTFDIQVVGYEITFNANTGSGTMESVEYVGAYTLPACMFTEPDGKQFKGWATSANGEVIDGATYNVTANVELFAIWEDIPVVKYDVTFNANGGTGTMSPVEYAGTYTLPTCAFTAPDGKKFEGWATTANGEVINGTTYNVTADVELFAIWEDIPVVNFDVTFNANGGTGTMSPVEYAGIYTLPTCTFTAPDGKQFKGWSTSANGEVIDGATYNVTANVELFAIWEDIPHNHDHGTTWESDANNHWNECSCGDKANVGTHADSDNNGKCDTCDYQMGNGGAPETPDEPKDGLSGGAIAGIVVGSVAVAGLGGFALVWFVIKKKSFADLIAIFKKK